MNQGSQRQLFANGDNATVECSRVFPHPITPANKSLRGSRGPEAGVRGIPSPFFKIFKRGRDTPHPSLLPLLRGKTFLTGCCAFNVARTNILAMRNLYSREHSPGRVYEEKRSRALLRGFYLFAET